jgi:hypothetical protein
LGDILFLDPVLVERRLRTGQHFGSNGPSKNAPEIVIFGLVEQPSPFAINVSPFGLVLSSVCRYDAEQGQGEEFLIHATECKNIWLPMGEIFAN